MLLVNARLTHTHIIQQIADKKKRPTTTKLVRRRRKLKCKTKFELLLRIREKEREREVAPEAMWKKASRNNGYGVRERATKRIDLCS